MVSERRVVKLKDVIEINPKRDLDKGTIASYVPMSNLGEWKRKIQEVEKREFTGSGTKFINGDTLFARITPCLENGKTAYVDVLDEDEVGYGSTEYIVLREKEGITNNLFVYYLARSDDFRRYAIKTMTGTSGRQRVQTEAIAGYEFFLPPLEDQEKIAYKLGALDDKIEINQQINETLENIARAVFKSWFVDFDPVRAKMAGEPYPLTDEVMALFPDELVESELGMIPKGWEVKELGDEFNVVMGQSPPGSSYNEEGKGIPFYQGRTDFGFRYPSRRVYTTDPKRFAEKGDTLVSVRAPVGDINKAKERCCVGRGVAAVSHKSGYISYTYYSMLNLQKRFNQFEGEGTVYGSIGKRDFNSLLVIKPIKKLIKFFELKISHHDKYIKNCFLEISELKKLRNLLLVEMLQ